MRFDRRICIVTGAGSGIGAACARQFWTEGAFVVAADRDFRSVEGLARELDTRIVARRCDVTESREFNALVESAGSDFGRLDVLVNNVGDSIAGPLQNFTDDQWNWLLAVNLSSTFFGMRAALRRMLTQGSGAIVNISSGAGLNGSPGMAPYAAAKAAVINLTRTAGVETARTGVRVNSVTPGPIATPAAMRMLTTVPDGRAGYEARLLAGRMGEAREIANAVLFLASDEASYINGENLVVDGGASARHGEINLPQRAE